MEIKTSMQITEKTLNVKDVWEYHKDTRFSLKKWVAVDDILEAHRDTVCCPEDCWCWELEGDSDAN